jgi:hypothetical protein
MLKAKSFRFIGIHSLFMLRVDLECCMELRFLRAYNNNLAGSTGHHIAQGNPAFRIIHRSSIYDVGQRVRLFFVDTVNPFFRRVTPVLMI